MYLAITALLITFAGCGYGPDGTAGSDSTSTDATLSSAGTIVPGPATTQELVLSTPDLSSQPEVIMKANWGTGPGQVSLGDGDFGKGGPDTMAVSPDGKTIAVYDVYSDPRRVNFYANGESVGAVNLKTPPMAIAITDSREVYALYQTQPTSTVLHLAPSGEVLETLPIDGSLDPMAPLVWAGSSLYVFAGVGGTEVEQGYLPVLKDGTPVSFADPRAAIEKDYPLSSGHAALEKDPAGGFLLTLSGGDASPTAVHLTLPPALAEAGGSLYASAFDGLPVIMFFSSPEGGPSLGCFVAVDVTRGQTKAATVRFDWKVPGGGFVIGPDAVYVMSLDFATGMQLLRVPFK